MQMALEKELAAKNRLEKEMNRWKGSDGKELERLRNEIAALETAKQDSLLDLRRLERRCAFVLGKKVRQESRTQSEWECQYPWRYCLFATAICMASRFTSTCAMRSTLRTLCEV